MAQKETNVKLKHWRELFADKEADTLKNRKRIQEIEVAQSELNNLKKGSQIYIGSEKTVFFQAELSEIKSTFKKEQNRLKKLTPSTSVDLCF